jgi:hypothetical protein
MRCLICADARFHIAHDAVREAVAVCMLCGAGVCMEHIRRHAVADGSLQPSEMAYQRHSDTRTPQVCLCTCCARYLHDASRGDGAHRSFVELLADRITRMGRPRDIEWPVLECMEASQLVE